MSPNNLVLFNGVLGPRLLNELFASCSFINLIFTAKHDTFFIFITFEFTCSLSSFAL